METPKHGEIRKHYTKTDYDKPIEAHTPDGRPLSLFGGSHTYTVSERWCDTCQDWQEAKGIIGGMLCPKCHTSW